MITRMKRGECVEVESTVAETVEYRGLTIEVHELAGEAKFRFMPLILERGLVVRRIFVRSKTAYVSLEHFAKRAVDHFLATGEWPKKQGMTVYLHDQKPEESQEGA